MTQRVRPVVRLRANPRRRRAIGLALVAYGVLGLGLIVPAILLLGGLPDRGGISAQAELGDALDASRDTLGDAARTARDAAAGLGATATAAGSAGDFMGDLSVTLRGLAASLRTSILGAQPFAGMAAEFERVAERADRLSVDLGTVRSTVRVGADDLVELAARLELLERRLVDVRSSLERATGDGLALARILGVSLLAWLAVPAAVSLWLGLRLLRRLPPAAPTAE